MPKGGVYRPRNPRASSLYQCADRHISELLSEGRLQRLLEERVIDRFLKCGDPHHGFARIYCPNCRHDFLLAFSCKARYFCPSCHQKGVAMGSRKTSSASTSPTHVFTVPRMLRRSFAQARIARRVVPSWNGWPIRYTGAGVRGVRVDPVRSDLGIWTSTPSASDGRRFVSRRRRVRRPARDSAKLLEQGFRCEVLKLLVAETRSAGPRRRACSPGAQRLFRPQRRAVQPATRRVVRSRAIRCARRFPRR